MRTKTSYKTVDISTTENKNRLKDIHYIEKAAADLDTLEWNMEGGLQDYPEIQNPLHEIKQSFRILINQLYNMADELKKPIAL